MTFTLPAVQDQIRFDYLDDEANVCFLEKTGPEAGQYFHVPLALCVGYETREEYIETQEQSNSFCPI